MNEETQNTDNQDFTEVSYDFVVPQNIDEPIEQNQEELWKKAFEKIRVSC